MRLEDVRVGMKVMIQVDDPEFAFLNRQWGEVVGFDAEHPERPVIVAQLYAFSVDELEPIEPVEVEHERPGVAG